MTPEQIRQAADLLPTSSIAAIARLLGVSRSTLYARVPELAGRQRTTVQELPADTRPVPSVAVYDELLTRTRTAAGDA